MRYPITVGNEFYIPVKIGTKEQILEIFDGDTKIFEFKVPEGNGAEFDYAAKVNASQYNGRELTFCGDFSMEFFQNIATITEEVVDDKRRPQVHFTPKYGWINDPNGLIFDGEQYHLYFQHNPFNIQWENMSWGYATSKNLLDFTWHGDAMYPDERGTMFSGCGVIKDNVLCFPYTVAGGTSHWSEGKPFYQGLATSTDQGKTLQKQQKPLLGITGKDSRDPKIFYHQATKHYVMILYLEENDFGIFISEDFENWEKTQHFTVEKAWECPGLIEVPVEGGGTKWMFFSADGFYYWGDFDGYTFTSDFKRHEAYFGGGFYATQTFWGVQDRIIAVPWMRMQEGRNGHCYQGAFGIPKEYTARKQGDDYVLIQRNIREFEQNLQTCDEIPNHKAFTISFQLEHTICLKLCGSEITIDSSEKTVSIDGQVTTLSFSPSKAELIFDFNLLEIIFDDTYIGAFMIKGEENGNIKGCSSGMRIDSDYCIKSIK